MESSATQRLLSQDGAPPASSGGDQESQLNEDIKEFEDIITKFLTNALHGSANLANMLPTGTVIFFQMLDPLLFRAGHCEDKHLSAIFLIVCSLVCFVLSFTDSFQAPNGKVYYGLATFRGMWTPQLASVNVDLSKYRITLGDFVHALLAIFTFMTTTTFSTDVVSCFFKVPDTFIRAAPSLSGFLVSAVFVVFPSTRHGVGFPLTPASSAGEK